MSVYDRNKGYPGRKPNLWIRYVIDEPTRAKFALSERKVREPANTGDKRVARAFEAMRKREVRDGTWRPPADLSTRATVAQYGAEWLAAREAAGIKTARHDAARFRIYIEPALGAKRLDEVSRDDVKALVSSLLAATSERTGKQLAPRMVHHVYGVLRGMYRSALEEERVLRSPCTLRIRKAELPKKRDADPRWRMQAVFTREEVEQLISDERVPLQRRVLYALLFLAGVRFGEAAGRQWRDYDPKAAPLGRLLIPTQYEDEETKTEEPRAVPVHPTLAAVLARWKLHGFPVLLGRSPTPDDLIVPKLRGDGPQDVRRAWMNLQRDLTALGMRARRTHDTRRTFISLALADGADRYLLQYVTHGAPKASAFDAYNTPPWHTLCAELAKLNVSLLGASVQTLRASSASGPGHTLGHTSQNQADKLAGT